MNRQDLRDYGLALGVEYAELRDWALGKAVRFLHKRCQDGLDFEAYEQVIDFVDKGDHWISENLGVWFISRELTEARQVLRWWLEGKLDYLQYQDSEYQSWIEARRNPEIDEI
jgi:hypothetical protein